MTTKLTKVFHFMHEICMLLGERGTGSHDIANNICHGDKCLWRQLLYHMKCCRRAG